MRTRGCRGLTLYDLTVYLACATLVGTATLSILVAADRDRRAVTAISADGDVVRRAADLLARDVRCAATVRIEDGAVVAGDVRWARDGDTLVRSDAEGARIVASHVAAFDVQVDADGVAHATIAVAPSDAQALRGASVRIAARPFAAHAVAAEGDR